MEVIPEHDWRAAAELARACNSQSSYAIGLRLVPAGAALARRLDLPTDASQMEWIKAHPGSATAYALGRLTDIPRDRAARLGRGVPLRPLRAAANALRRRDIATLRAGCWALTAHRRLRRQLRGGGLDQVALRPAAAGGLSAERVVNGVLRRAGASCLERSLVRQRWYASQGTPRVLVIGVTAPGASFHAHAWLDGETSAEHHRMVEILRAPHQPSHRTHGYHPPRSGSAEP